MKTHLTSDHNNKMGAAPTVRVKTCDGNEKFLRVGGDMIGVGGELALNIDNFKLQR